MKKAYITGYGMSIILDKDFTSLLLEDNKNITSYKKELKAKRYNELFDDGLINSDFLYKLIYKKILLILENMNFYDSNTKKFNDKWRLLKKGLVCASNFFELFEIEKGILSKSLINNINYVFSKISKQLMINSVFLNVSTACSTGGSALVVGTDLVKEEECDVVIVMGYEIKSSIPEYGMSVIGAITKDKVKPFDKERSGTALAEGIGIIVISKFKLNDLDLEIKGVGVANDAFNPTGPEPTGEGLENAMKSAILDSKLNINEIQYINSHGSGTKLNDKIETLVIKRIFKEYAKKLYINSSKSLVGHTLGAAGIIEAVMTIISCQTGKILETVNSKIIDEECDLNYCFNNEVECEIKNALTSSIGFGGINVCIIIGKED